MKKIFILSTLACLSICAWSQKFEIKAFEKQNKDMLKQLKKQYGTTPDVMMSNEGLFYMVVARKEDKKAPERFMLLDEVGSPLYNDWIDKYKAISDGYFYVGLNNSGKTKWGVVNSKGKLVFPIQYDNIQYSEALEAGNFTSSSKTYWHPANDGFWLITNESNNIRHNTFYTADGGTVTHEYDGVINSQLSYFWTIAPSGMSKTENKKGLLTFDGKVIFPQEYNSFYIETSGLVNCMKKDPDGLTMYGGKMLDGSSDIVVPPVFCGDVTYDTESKTIKCKQHRDDEYQVYNPSLKYELTFRDKGERLFDMGKYQDVITFYEGEGYGSIWGDYYMGLSAEALGKEEMEKMDDVISTLKSSTDYYLPIKNPEKYSFDAGTISGMYTSASIYLEKFINNGKIPADDPKKIKARKLRGEIVTTRNNITKKIDDYGTALRAASEKNVQREAQIAAEQAQQQETADALATSLTNLLFGGSKKK